MKGIGSAAVAILVAIVAIWVIIKVLGLALKLVGILIVVGLAVGAYVAVERLVAGRKRLR